MRSEARKSVRPNLQPAPSARSAWAACFLFVAVLYFSSFFFLIFPLLILGFSPFPFRVPDIRNFRPPPFCTPSCILLCPDSIRLGLASVAFVPLPAVFLYFSSQFLTDTPAAKQFSVGCRWGGRHTASGKGACERLVAPVLSPILFDASLLRTF